MGTRSGTGGGIGTWNPALEPTKIITGQPASPNTFVLSSAFTGTIDDITDSPAGTLIYFNTITSRWGISSGNTKDKGVYATETALNTAIPTALAGEYALITFTNTYWFWDAVIVTPAWVDSGSLSVPGSLQALNNLSDISDTTAAIVNLGVLSSAEINAQLDLKESLSNKDIDSTFTTADNVKYSTKLAVKTFILATRDALLEGVVADGDTLNKLYNLVIAKALNTITITGSNGLTGGGDLIANRIITAIDATTLVKGVTKLSNSFNTNSQVLATTEKALSDGLADLISTLRSGVAVGGDTLKKLDDKIALNELLSNKVLAFQATPDDVKYPTEKLVKDSLDLKSNIADIYIISVLDTKFADNATNDRSRTNHTGTQAIATVINLQASIDSKQNISEKGQANGYAELDGASKVPASQLPSYVDDILEYATSANFPITGETGKVYVALDTNLTYRWSGTIYVKLNDVDLTAYFNKTNDDLDNIIESATKKHFTITDKIKLDAIEAGAEVNVQPDWNQASSGQDDFIKNKPTLATVATSGDHEDLSNKGTNTHAEIDTQLTTLSTKADKITSPAIGKILISNSNGEFVESAYTPAELNGNIDGSVNTFADLPSAAANTDSIYQVKTTTGSILASNKKDNGWYGSDGANWILFGYKQASVIQQILTGFSSHGSVANVTASDSLLQALKKIRQRKEHFMLKNSSNLSDVSNQQTALNNVTNVSIATTGQVLTKSSGGNAAWEAASGGTTVIDNLNSTSTTDALSANQGNFITSKISALTQTQQSWKLEVTSGFPTYSGGISATELQSSGQLFLCQGNAESSGIGLNGDFINLWSAMDSNRSLNIFDEDSSNAGYYFNTVGSPVTFSDINLKENFKKYNHDILSNISKISIYNYEWISYNKIIAETKEDLKVIVYGDRENISNKYRSQKRFTADSTNEDIALYLKRKIKRCEQKKLGFGFIAQELQQAFPDAIIKDKSGFLQVDWQKITIYSVEAIKQLYNKIGVSNPSFLDEENIINFEFNLSSGKYFNFSSLSAINLIVKISDNSLNYFKYKLRELEGGSTASIKYYYNIIDKEYVEFFDSQTIKTIIKNLEDSPNEVVKINDISLKEWNFNQKKIQKIRLLEQAYANSKKITIQNGKTLIIKHDTPERNYFMDNLNNLKRIEDMPNSVLSYRQKEGSVYLGFSTLVYVWRRLFLELFTNTRDSKTLETRSFKNKEIYDVKKLKIKNSISIEELNNISWAFLESVVININLEAKKILDDVNSPQYTKDAINALKDKNDQIHLIKEL